MRGGAYALLCRDVAAYEFDPGGEQLMRRLFLLLFVPTVFSPLTRAQTCNLNATTANFASQLAAANPGQTLCLATGSYGTFSGATKSSPGVTITAAAGATPTMDLNFTSASPTPQWLILDHLTINGGVICGPTNNVTFTNDLIRDQLTVWQNGPDNGCGGGTVMNNNNIVFDNDRFDWATNSNQGGGFGDGKLMFWNTKGNDPNPAGVTIKNSTFTNGCSDGIDFIGAGRGVTIGPNNTFSNLIQGNCGVHVDSIQFQGTDSPGPTITGNYFHDNETGIIGYDGANDATITHNVFLNIARSDETLGEGNATGIISHNTLFNDDIGCGVTHQGNVCHAVFINNIAMGMLIQGAGSPSQNDYNLWTGGSSGGGSHSLVGKPTYVGGSNPTTYAGYALTSTSLGHNAGSDGKDIGVNVSGSISSQPLPPTGLVASVQ
jgi:hypothetical protein